MNAPPFIPHEMRDALDDMLKSSAEIGPIEGWDRLSFAVRFIPYGHDETTRSILAAFVEAAPLDRLPQIIAALRAGACCCRAYRNELEAGRISGSN